MGADSFTVIQCGKTASEAFNRAVAHAEYNYGHAGYSGTIAEKSDFKYFGEVKGFTVRRFENHAFAFVDAYEMAYEYNRDTGCSKMNPDELKKALKKLPAGLKPILHTTFARTFLDKWGPACAVRISGQEAVRLKRAHGRQGTRDRVYLFTGLASS